MGDNEGFYEGAHLHLKKGGRETVQDRRQFEGQGGSKEMHKGDREKKSSLIRRKRVHRGGLEGGNAGVLMGTEVI